MELLRNCWICCEWAMETWSPVFRSPSATHSSEGEIRGLVSSGIATASTANSINSINTRELLTTLYTMDVHNGCTLQVHYGIYVYIARARPRWGGRPHPSAPNPGFAEEDGIIWRQKLKGRCCQGKGCLRLNREDIQYIHKKWHRSFLIDCRERYYSALWTHVCTCRARRSCQQRGQISMHGSL